MKRFSLVSLFIIAVLLLSACSATGSSSNGTPGTYGTSVAVTQVSAAPAVTSMATSPTGSASTQADVSGMAPGGVGPVAGTQVGTAAGTQAGVLATPLPVTGMSGLGADSLRVSQLLGYTVVSNDGSTIGMVNDLVIDLRNAVVCASAPAGTAPVTAGTAMPGGTATGASGVGMSATSTVAGDSVSGASICTVNTTGAAQKDGLIAFVVVSTANTTVGSTGSTSSTAVSVTAVPLSSTTMPLTSTGTAVSGAIGTVAGGQLIPIPWNVVSFDLLNHRLVVNAPASALSGAPSFTANSWPDLFGPDWTAKLSFWNSYGGGINTNGAGAPGTTATPAP